MVTKSKFYQIKVLCLELLKKNVYGFSILPSAVISRFFHHKLSRHVGFLIFLLLFGLLNSDYRRFSNTIRLHLRKKGEFHGQQLQDIAAIAFGSVYESDNQHRYFVDIGAAYPYKYSNSAELQNLGWHGVLVEPNPFLYQKLMECRNAPGIKLFQNAIGRRNDSSKLLNSGPLSSIIREERTDIYDNLRREIASKTQTPIIEVSMLSPEKLLQLCDAPKTIHFLSIDTEGNELAILQEFPFDKYLVNFVTCEHNFEWDNLKKIDSLMEKFGFRRVMPFWSAQDAWFLRV